MKWLDTLERRFSRYAIPDLMNWIVAGQILVYGIALLLRGDIANFLTLNRAGILAGQPWRLITFVLVPDSYDILYFALGCYFEWFVGTTLEKSWGTGWFNLYYLFGVLGSWIACAVTGYSSAYCLSLAMFLAFAILYPDMQVMLFFVIPIKVKWMGWLSAGLWVYNFLLSGLGDKIGLVCGMLGFILFFGPNVWRDAKAWYRRRQWQRRNRR